MGPLTGSGGSRISHGGGGHRPRMGGARTPKAVTFQKFCMSKQKNMDPEGGRRTPGTPLDPPMTGTFGLGMSLTTGFKVNLWSHCYICLGHDCSLVSTFKASLWGHWYLRFGFGLF